MKLTSRFLFSLRVLSKKYMFLCVFILANVLLLNASQTSISQTTTKLWDSLKNPLDSLNTRYIYFDVIKSTGSDLVNFRLTDFALNEGFVVSDIKNDSVTVISILSDNKTLVKRQNYILFTKEDTFIYPQYLIKISQGNRIVLSRTLSMNENLSKKTKTISRWYEPLMLSAVIGSLVYLIYYGNH